MYEKPNIYNFKALRKATISVAWNFAIIRILPFLNILVESMSAGEGANLRETG